MLNAIDEAYYERNQLVAALARLFPSGLRKTDIEDWDPAWHNCVFIDLPTGQVSWHFHDREAHLFEGVLVDGALGLAVPGAGDGELVEDAELHRRLISDPQKTQRSQS